MRGQGGFDDRLGPTVLAVALFAAVVVNFVLRVTGAAGSRKWGFEEWSWWRVWRWGVKEALESRKSADVGEELLAWRISVVQNCTEYSLLKGLGKLGDGSGLMLSL
jgi:hypothetical protein